ncbi:MAG TPA: methyltransferase domain-containing protein [Solirubrobacteraceae bacterium]|nr:methyltransferase domain-containing protein [Solirubrobacteraceae bacterium]
MSDWQERITRETPPAIQAEHELRYRAAAPLILAGGPWADLGCGNGIAAARALGERRPRHVVLVDAEQDAVSRAAQTLALEDAVTMTADLTDGDSLARIEQELSRMPGAPVLTCFEVVEHLRSFVPLLEWASALVEQHDATFVLSVPNDAFWSIENPHHQTVWSEGAFAELRRLLPASHTLLRQVALSGSTLVPFEQTHAQRLDVTAQAGGERVVATHFIAAFGPRHGELGGGALVVQTDMLEQRRWERQRENDLALMQKLAAEHEAEVHELDLTIMRQRDELQERTVWFDEWRAYIHELERELGRPLSGAGADELPERTGADAAKDAAEDAGARSSTSAAAPEPGGDDAPGQGSEPPAGEPRA